LYAESFVLLPLDKELYNQVNSCWLSVPCNKHGMDEIIISASIIEIIIMSFASRVGQPTHVLVAADIFLLYQTRYLHNPRLPLFIIIIIVSNMDQFDNILSLVNQYNYAGQGDSDEPPHVSNSPAD
jgi:hypothetical protein